MSEGKIDFGKLPDYLEASIDVIEGREGTPRSRFHYEGEADSRRFAKLLIEQGWDGTGPFKNPMVYLIWTTSAEPGDPEASHELRAVCTNEEQVEIFKQMILSENKVRRRKVTNIEVERRDLNHLYGHSMFKAQLEEEATDA